MADENTLPDAPGGDAPAETSLHDDIASAFDTVETRDAPPADAPGKEPPAGGDRAPAAPPGERARGPDGKFVPGPETHPRPPTKPLAPSATPSKPEAAPLGKQPLAAGQKAPDAPKAPPADPAAAAAAVARAPASWPPAAREHWAKLPAEVQQVVARRETEVQRTMQESAKAREALTHVQGVFGPFAQNIAASGQDALTMVGSLLNADNTLRHGSVGDKASLIAGIIKSYGVDIVALDAVLAGQQPPNDPNAAMADRLRQEMQAQLQPMRQYFDQLQGKRQQAFQQINTDAAGEVETFGTDGEHEFFEDVRLDMADIIDMMSARGVRITLQDAYDRAIKLNPQVSEIVAKRAEAERANAAQQAAQRARRTAVSLSSAPAPAGAGPGPAGDDRRGAIEAAWDQSSSG